MVNQTPLTSHWRVKINHKPLSVATLPSAENVVPLKQQEEKKGAPASMQMRFKIDKRRQSFEHAPPGPRRRNSLPYTLTIPKLLEEKSRRHSFDTNNNNSFHINTIPQSVISPDTVFQKPDKVYQKRESIFQAPENLYQKRESIFQAPENLYQKRESIFQVPENLYQRRESIFQVPETVYQKRESIFQAPENLFQKRESIFQAPENLPKAVTTTTEEPEEDPSSPQKKMKLDKDVLMDKMISKFFFYPDQTTFKTPVESSR